MTKMKVKYIVYDDGFNGECLVMFSCNIDHSEMAAGLKKKPISAGFLLVETGKCFGESITLGISSRPEKDDLLLKCLR